MARRYYNGAVRNLNISIESFPDVLVARPLGFKEEPFFELDDRATQGAAPQITFPGAKA
jgi:LemA protein